MSIKPKSDYEDLRNHELKGKGTFEDKKGKRFVLKWLVRFRIVNKEKAYERHVLDKSSGLTRIINENMQRVFSKYTLEVISIGAMEKLNDFVHLHMILDSEVKEGLLNPSLIPHHGVIIDALVQENFGLVTKGKMSTIRQEDFPIFLRNAPCL